MALHNNDITKNDVIDLELEEIAKQVSEYVKKRTFDENDKPKNVKRSRIIEEKKTLDDLLILKTKQEEKTLNYNVLIKKITEIEEEQQIISIELDILEADIAIIAQDLNIPQEDMLADVEVFRKKYF